MLIKDKIKQSPNEELLANPKVQAMLKTIRYAEGTSGANGYNTRVGGEQFSDLSKKPGKKTYIKSIGDYSSAEGAFQFLNSTWSGVAKKLGLSDFSPRSQDLAAIELIKQRGALQDILDDNFQGAINKLSPEWASLPRADGNGTYANQKAKKLDKLASIFYDGKEMKKPSATQTITTNGTNLAIPQQSTNLASVPEQQEEVKQSEEVTQATQKLQQRQNEEDFIKELYSQQQEQPVVEAPIKQEIPQQNALDRYAQIESFIDNPVAQQGGVIEDDMGQWNHPGEVTKINSPNITMSNVNYPVLGVSDKGQQQMMYPNQDYYFKNANSVTEYPQLTNKEKSFLQAIQQYKNKK